MILVQPSSTETSSKAGFFLGEAPVTYDEFRGFFELTGQVRPYDWKAGQLPVVSIRLHTILEFCNWLSRTEGLCPCYSITTLHHDTPENGRWTEARCSWFGDEGGYRLPTESEWLWAARGGVKSHNTRYAGSDNLDAVAWHGGNSAGCAHEVGQKAPNELGLFDMSGNVFEACCSNREPLEFSGHGGCWAASYEKFLPLGVRYDNYSRANTMGFRLCRSQIIRA